MDILSALTRPKLLALKFRRIAEVATADGDIDAVERDDGCRRRRAAAGAAATARSSANGSAGAASAAGSAASGVNSDDDDLADSDDDESSVVVRVQTIDVASSIGGKIWTSRCCSALGSPRTGRACRRRRPTAAGGGRACSSSAQASISGLAAALAHPHLHVTLSDYDDAVNANLHEFIGSPPQARASTSRRSTFATLPTAPRRCAVRAAAARLRPHHRRRRRLRALARQHRARGRRVARRRAGRRRRLAAARVLHAARRPSTAARVRGGV